MTESKNTRDSSTLETEVDERKPLIFGCLLLVVIFVVLGGAFALGAWSVLQGASPPN
jgi:hypothetical protein